MLLNNFSILWSLYLVSNQYSIPPAYSLSPVFRITVNIFLIFLLSLFIKTAAGEGYSQCLLLFLSIHKPSFFLFFSFFFQSKNNKSLTIGIWYHEKNWLDFFVSLNSTTSSCPYYFNFQYVDMILIFKPTLRDQLLFWLQIIWISFKISTKSLPTSMVLIN